MKAYPGYLQKLNVFFIRMGKIVIFNFVFVFNQPKEMDILR